MPGKSRDEWTTRMLADPAWREREFRKAARAETVFSLAAAAFACLTIWGFTSGRQVLGGIEAETIGGIAVLCFGGCMAIAQGGGIRKRFLSLVAELERRQS